MKFIASIALLVTVCVAQAETANSIIAKSLKVYHGLKSISCTLQMTVRGPKETVFMHMDQQAHGNKRYTRITFPNKAETFVVIVDDGHSTYKETNSEPFHKFSTKQPRGALPILDTVETAYHKHIGPLQVVQSVQVHGVNALVIKGKFKEGIGYYYFDSTTYKLLKAKVFSGKVELMNIDFIEQELNPVLDMSIFKH